ncbi:MAG: EI24 domain-containing protein [Bacteroidetes bacterium]|nr:EI24 domain-containing protein [Bacteroidota bacterium]
MAFWSDLGKGISSHFEAVIFIAKNKLWGYFLYPVFLIVLLHLAGAWSIYSFSEMLVNKVGDYLTPELNTGYAWVDVVLLLLIKLFRFVAGFVLHLYLLAFFLKILRYLVLLFCSPMMALLSAKVEELKNGNKYPFAFGQFMKDIFRGMMVVLRNIFLELLLMLLALIIGWIPVIGWLTVPFIYIISWYFLGFNMMDYTCERKRMSVSQSASFIRKRKGIAIGNGLIFALMLDIPYAGIVIAPVIASAAATLATVEAMDQKK